MTDEMQTPWTLSATSEYNSAMHEFTDLTFITQHKVDLSTTQRLNWGVHQRRFFWSRENADTDYNLLIIHSWPYSEKHGLWDSGWVTCECSCNWGGWENDHKRYQRKVGLCYKFTIKYRAKSLGNSLAVKIASDRAFYPALLFLRFLVASKSGDPFLVVVLSYELSSHPAYFFEAKNILCTADTHQIAQAIWEYAIDTSCEAVMNCFQMHDGGTLLHRWPWRRTTQITQ